MLTRNETYFKYSVILIGIIVVFLLFRKCGDGGDSNQQNNDTINKKVDTLWLPSKKDTFYTPEVVKIETVYVPYYKTDTLETFEYLPIDSAEILKDYLSTRYYNDSVKTEYGIVTIVDTITQNKIKSRGVKTSFNIPIVKETITVREKKKNIAYVGFGAMGSEQSFLEQTEITVGFKTKNDKLYSVEAALSRSGNVLIGGKILIPIRLNKK
ncbi:MAG TPA: hypothetical protein PKV73_00995 [Agriterribacter sp.]|nr:hypothetical protein [Agriterribacter sp.]